MIVSLSGKPRAKPEGPEDSDLLIVGDFPTHEDLRCGGVFQDLAGREFSKTLHEAGILRTECRLTYLSPHVPLGEKRKYLFEKKTKGIAQGFSLVQDRYVSPEISLGLEILRDEVARCKPKTIVALGDEALWALTGESSITKWRGSELFLSPVWSGPYDPTIRVIPSLSPREVIRVWEWRALLHHDLKRARNLPPPEPKWDFRVPLCYPEAKEILSNLIRRIDEGNITSIAADIETVERSYIDCIGFAWARSEAVCIPFIRASTLEPLHSPEEEAELALLCCEVMEKGKVIGQNWLYDAQYIARYWGRRIEPEFDTMIAHAVCFPGTPKSLDHISSLYLDWHRYWKHELGRAAKVADDSIRWDYNCKDCCSTFALREPLLQQIKDLELSKPFRHEMDLFNPLMNMMMRGVRQDQKTRPEYMNLLMEQQRDREEFFEEITEKCFADVQFTAGKAKTPWYRSPTQQKKLFYEILQLPMQYNRKTGRPSTDDDALKKLMEKEPLFQPLFEPLAEYRSLGVFLSTYIFTKLDHDKRFHCSYGPVGTETFRFNSSEDVFGFGGNGQNIPTGNL